MLGQTKRNSASVLSACIGGVNDFPASGVPGIGFRKLTGMESASSSRSAKAVSTSSSGVSPIPTMTPEHGDIPLRFALSTVSTRWS
ncbi:hypothetical protein D3C84_876680 [compost metagenome]